MPKKLCCAAAVVFFCNAYFGQQAKDTVNIKEVVVTGQYSPQSIKKSLYKVEVISSDDIKRMAANTVAEVLNQSLNILITPTQNSGDSKAEILGLGADYTKVLVDNVPIVGDTGLGSNIDLTKLSLDNVERIEIVKGSMGVEFGNNAVAGVINIITKKSSSKKWMVRGFVQEETVGNEYNWVDYGKGKHLQSLSIAHNISDKWYAALSLNRTDFQGYWGSKQGKNYFGTDGLRGYEWQPKEQWNPAFTLRFSSPKTQLFYKADYLLEQVNFYNAAVEEKYLGGGERTYYARDRNYYTDRMLHHLNIQTEIFKKTKYSGDFSYQKQTRKKEDYIFDIPARKVLSTEDKDTDFRSETFYSRGAISNFLNKKNTDVQIGYEGDYTKGLAGRETGSFGDKSVIKDVLNVGVFASAEFQLNSSWFLRPGVRWNFSDTFNALPNFSLVLKNRINDQSEFRAILGSANKNPTFEQLFTFLFNVNHDIRGNENLKPENSYSGTIFYTLHSKPEQPLKWTVDASTLYLQTQDRIELATINEHPLQFLYVNVNTYQSWLNTISGKISNKNFGLSAGFSVIGRMMNLTNSPDEKYRYSTEVNASGYYNILKTNTTIAFNFKGVGKSDRLTEDRSLGVTQYILKPQNAFSLLDGSISQEFWKSHFTLTAGVRNIFDVTNVLSDTNSGGGAHNSGGTSESMFYGRSYFARLNFNF